MTHARTRFAAVLLAMLLAVASCASDKPTPVISQEPAPPAPAALPANWNESTVQVPVDAGAATYVSPSNPQRLRAALILAGPDRAGQVAARELSVMLAQHGVASLRFDGAPSGSPGYAALLDRAGKGLTALAERAGLGDDRLLAVGGGAKSDYWLKALATSLQTSVDVPVAGDFGGAFGAARLAMMAAGDLDPSGLKPPPIAKTIDPDTALADAFADAHARYQTAYAQTRML